MARRLTPKQIAAGFGGKRAKNARKKRATNKKGHKTMAKKKRRSGGGGKKRRRGGGRRSGLALSKRDVLLALGAAAVYGYVGSQAEDGKEWAKDFAKKPPVIKPIGHAGTMAVAAYAASRLGVAPKYTKPIAIGLAAVALLNLGRRGFKLYETDDEAHSLMAGDDGGTYIEGDVHLDEQYQEAA